MEWDPVEPQAMRTVSELVAHLVRSFLVITILASDRKHLFEGPTSPPPDPQCTTNESVMAKETNGFLLLLLL